MWVAQHTIAVSSLETPIDTIGLAEKLCCRCSQRNIVRVGHLAMWACKPVIPCNGIVIKPGQAALSKGNHHALRHHRYHGCIRHSCCASTASLGWRLSLCFKPHLSGGNAPWLSGTSLLAQPCQRLPGRFPPWLSGQTLLAEPLIPSCISTDLYRSHEVPTKWDWHYIWAAANGPSAEVKR